MTPAVRIAAAKLLFSFCSVFALRRVPPGVGVFSFGRSSRSEAGVVSSGT